MASVELFLRLSVSLVIIGGLVLLIRRLLGGRLAIDRRGPGIEVLARRQVGQKSSLVLVRCGARTLLLGADGERLSFLTEGRDLVGDPGAPIDLVLDDRPVASSTIRPALPSGSNGERVVSVDEVLADLEGASHRSPLRTLQVAEAIEADGVDVSTATPRAGTATVADLQELLEQRTTDARMRQTGPQPEPTRMSVIEALREVTVRKG